MNEHALSIDTLAVRAGSLRSEFGEHSEALYLTSSFAYRNAAEAAARFAEDDAYVYSRFSNPNITMLQSRLAALEGGEDAVVTASGMSAILALVLALLKSGDHLVASQGLFASTQQMFATWLPRFGIECDFAQPTDLESWRAAVRPNTRLFFAETPSNPCMDVVDIAAVADIAHRNSARLVIDNSFCTPILQRPLALGADIVMHSATKMMDGQGRVLGGALIGKRDDIQEIYKFLRTTGPALSPFNAWVILKGLETLPTRMAASCASAQELAQWLEHQPGVRRVLYPGLASHPQHALAARQQSMGGNLISFSLEGGQAAAWRFIDATRLFSITGNLGDSRSTITHPASTTHGRLAPEAREAAGIDDGLVRLSIGLEATADLRADLIRAIGAI